MKLTYAEAIQFLCGLQFFGMRLGLENAFKLAALAGHPQQKLRFIHVAGTNGKGSTCAMLESIYRTAGLRVGLFTSPHLVAFGERIQVDRQLISEADVARLTEGVRAMIEQDGPVVAMSFRRTVDSLRLDGWRIPLRPDCPNFEDTSGRRAVAAGFIDIQL